MTLPHRSQEGRVLFGTAAALARALGLPPLVMRTLFVIAALASGLGVLLYAVLTLALPDEDSRARGFVPRAHELGRELRSLFQGFWYTLHEERRSWQVRRVEGSYLTRNRAFLGGVLLLAGAVWFLATLRLLSWLTIERGLALVILAAGVYLIRSRRDR